MRNLLAGASALAITVVAACGSSEPDAVQVADKLSDELVPVAQTHLNVNDLPASCQKPADQFSCEVRTPKRTYNVQVKDDGDGCFVVTGGDLSFARNIRFCV